MQYFGEKLKVMRELKHLSQEELGRRIGLSGSVISAYEKSRKYPSIETLIKMIKICSELSVSADYLLGLSDDMRLTKTYLTDTQISSLRSIIRELEMLNLSNSKDS